MSDRSVRELLRDYYEIEQELRKREIITTFNKVTGDLAEYLFCKAFGWEKAPNAEKGWDAIDQSGVRYQIKCRRLHSKNASRQLSALRQLDHKPFDYLAAVLLDEQYAVKRAALIPHSIVLEHSRFTTHVNAHRFLLRDSIWDLEDVRDVTLSLREAENSAFEAISA